MAEQISVYSRTFTIPFPSLFICLGIPLRCLLWRPASFPSPLCSPSLSGPWIHYSPSSSSLPACIARQQYIFIKAIALIHIESNSSRAAHSLTHSGSRRKYVYWVTPTGQRKIVRLWLGVSQVFFSAFNLACRAMLQLKRKQLTPNHSCVYQFLLLYSVNTAFRNKVLLPCRSTQLLKCFTMQRRSIFCRDVGSCWRRARFHRSLSRPHMKASSFSCRLGHQLVYAAAYKCIASQPAFLLGDLSQL